jgi:hypothetical protein
MSQNGVLVYPPGSPVHLPPDYPELPRNVASRFGFKLITITQKNGDQVRVWAAALEQDYRNLEAKRLGINPEEVVINYSEDFTGDCHFFNQVCTGTCPNGLECQAVFDRAGNIVGCGGCSSP